MKIVTYIFFGLLILNGMRGAINLSEANDRIAQANTARNFVYDDATPKEKEIWLNRLASYLTDGMIEAATGPNAPDSSFVSISAKADAKRKQIRLDQILDAEPLPVELRQVGTVQLLKGSCKTLMTSPIGKQGITVQMRLRTISGKEYASADFSYKTCENYM